MWIELIGFDNTEPDYHVGAFLDNAGFVPEMMSFLLVSPDFVHGHQGMDHEIVLPPDLCSYGGRPYNLERRRQAWTNHQFKGLIEELQQRGVKVFCGVMNSFRSFIDGQHYYSPWCASHPEVWEVRHAGEESGAVNPLKRLADGSPYEDLFVAKLLEAIADYGFDGSHAGDGVAGPRRPIWMADYSDDMVGQFVEMMGVKVDLSCDGDPERAEQRAQYIWANLRHDWCTFYARRFNRFFAKLCDAMHGMGKQVVANNVWTQDPFQALYRYGLDYRGLAEAGVDAFILETVGAGNEIGAEGVPVELRFELNQVALFTKAYLPDTPLHCLNATGDTTENWDVLNHAPPVCEREHYTLGSLFLQDRQGFRHASDGPFVCLADGINSHQWRWMARNWQVAYEKLPTRVLGATIVWSEAALEAEFDDYVAHRTAPPHRLCAELMKRGAPLLSVLNVSDLGVAQGCLFVPRPELLPPPERDALLAYEGGPLITIGREGAGTLACRVYEEGREIRALETTLPGQLPEEMPEPPNYLYGIYSQPVDDEFWQACAELLIELSGTPVVTNGVTDARVLAYETEPGWVRLLIGNEAHYYVQPEVDLGREIREVRIASHFPGKPIYPQGTTLTTRVPPRGMVVLDVHVEGAVGGAGY
jgi:hypothetical protein